MVFIYICGQLFNGKLKIKAINLTLSNLLHKLTILHKLISRKFVFYIKRFFK